MRAQLLRADAEGYAQACLAIRHNDWRAGLAGIACPVQVVAGQQDAGTTVEMAQAITGAVPFNHLRTAVPFALSLALSLGLLIIARAFLRPRRIRAALDTNCR